MGSEEIGSVIELSLKGWLMGEDKPASIFPAAEGVSEGNIRMGEGSG